jgi:hypothetical protein
MRRDGTYLFSRPERPAFGVSNEYETAGSPGRCWVGVHDAVQ